MKGHRSRDKARRAVVPGHGRRGHGATSTAAKAPSIMLSAREKQEARAKRALARHTRWTLLGRAIRRLMGLP